MATHGQPVPWASPSLPPKGTQGGSEKKAARRNRAGSHFLKTIQFTLSATNNNTNDGTYCTSKQDSVAPLKPKVGLSLVSFSKASGSHFSCSKGR